MRTNQSMPSSTVIPELAYPDIGEAIDWLCNAFGFTLRLRIGNHRAQLNVGDGAIVLTEKTSQSAPPPPCGEGLEVGLPHAPRSPPPTLDPSPQGGGRRLQILSPKNTPGFP